MTVSGDLIYFFFLSCLSYNKKKKVSASAQQYMWQNSVCAILTSLKQSTQGVGLSLALASFLLVLN